DWRWRIGTSGDAGKQHSIKVGPAQTRTLPCQKNGPDSTNCSVCWKDFYWSILLVPFARRRNFGFGKTQPGAGLASVHWRCSGQAPPNSRRILRVWLDVFSGQDVRPDAATTVSVL